MCKSMEMDAWHSSVSTVGAEELWLCGVCVWGVLVVVLAGRENSAVAAAWAARAHEHMLCTLKQTTGTTLPCPTPPLSPNPLTPSRLTLGLHTHPLVCNNA